MNIKTLTFFATAAVMALSGCHDSDVGYVGGDPMQEGSEQYNTFDYSTVNDSVAVNIDYNLDLAAKVFFEIYDENPCTEGEYGTMVKTTDKLPLYSGFTGEYGVFRGTISLPTYVEKAYIYSPAFFAPSVIEATVSDGQLTANTASRKAPRKVVTSTSSPYYCYMDEEVADVQVTTTSRYRRSTTTLEKLHTGYEFNWHRWLGTYDYYNNGKINYAYTGSLQAKDVASLYTAHQTVINIDQDCPEEYRSYGDMRLYKDAEVAVTFVGQNTCWNSSIGYYYYQDGNAPTSLDDVNVILLFPNTQDGNYTVTSKSALSAGIDQGTAAQLIYYPNIASGSKEGATTIFPAGTRIGLVLACNAWGNRLTGVGWTTDVDKGYRAATSASLSMDNDKKAYGTPRTAVYKLKDYVMISFEDHTNDQNFSDVVLTTLTNPIDAIDDVPVADTTKVIVPDPEPTDTVKTDPDPDPVVEPEPDTVAVVPATSVTSTVNRGIYCFEDLWPSAGDYDLNDVMVQYTYMKTQLVDTLLVEGFFFQTFQNYAVLQNGLAIKLDRPIAATDDVKLYVKGTDGNLKETDCTYESEDNVIVLSNNVNPEIGAKYLLYITHNDVVLEDKANDAHPFIFRETSGGQRWEMHIANEEPTSKVDWIYFNTGDDKSDISNGVYYVRSGNYPFGFFLAGATAEDLSPMLDRNNEKTPIDQLYPKYTLWVTSNGAENNDWYK